MSNLLTKPWFASLGLLLLRVFTGVLLIHHGFEKLSNIDNFADAFVRPLHLPCPVSLSYLAAFSEIFGSLALITGFATRLGALAITSTISVAIYHAISTAGFNIFLLELLGLYFGSAFTILTLGPGKFSIDELITRFITPNIEYEKKNLELMINKTIASSNASPTSYHSSTLIP